MMNLKKKMSFLQEFFGGDLNIITNAYFIFKLFEEIIRKTIEKSWV